MRSLGVRRAGGDGDAGSGGFDSLESGGGSGDGLLACFLVLSGDTLLVCALDVSVTNVTLKDDSLLARANTEGSG